MAAYGEFMPTLEDVASLSKFPMFEGVNAIGVVLLGEGEVKLCYLTFVMTPSRMFGSWLR